MSRGRGRGSHEGQGGSTGQIRIPSTIQELEAYLYTLNESNIGQFGDKFADTVLQFASDEQKLKEALDSIVNAAFESKYNAELGGKLCERIIQGPAEEQEERRSIRTQFRAALLNRLKKDYSTTDSTRASSIEAWLAVFAFMCQIYKRVLVGNKPMQVLGNAIAEGMNDTLTLPDVIDDELECICENLKLCGEHLEEQSPALIAQLFTTLKTMCISAKSTCRARCLCLEIIELRLMGWKDPEKKLELFYRDALPDAIAEDECNT